MAIPPELGEPLSSKASDPSARVSLRSLRGSTEVARKRHDVLCLSHLRWDFVYQRPQHLLTRFAQESRVFFVEEPIFDAENAYLDVTPRDMNVLVVVPHLPPSAQSDGTVDAMLKVMLDLLMSEHNIHSPILWFYTPMALAWTRHLHPTLVIYDCMDELSAFKGAPTMMRERESDLMKWADLVFTGGVSLYEAKQHQHPHIYAFPSSIDAVHFAQARKQSADREDQAGIPHPRLGFFGVVDERMDLELLDQVAAARPDWHLVVIGPVVKVDPDLLPKRENIHYLGKKSYKDLPAYLAGWDVAIMPFARNESTKFISPTKTPEYLAAGRPVVSTSIRDVVRSYGEAGLVHIADSAPEFIEAVESALQEDSQLRLRTVDAVLGQDSWDRTWRRMQDLMDDKMQRRHSRTTAA